MNGTMHKQILELANAAVVQGDREVKCANPWPDRRATIPLAARNEIGALE